MVFLATLLFFFFDYVRPGNYVPGLDLLKLNAIIPVVAILGTLFGKTPVSNRVFASNVSTYLMGVLLVLLSISTLFATVTMDAYTVTKNVFAYMLIYWVIIRQVGDYARLRSMFMVLAFVHLLIAALNPTLFTDPDNRVGINSGAFLGDGNDFALSLNICIPLCLFLMLESKKKLPRIGWALAVVALVLGVVATKSRGGTVALGAVLAYFWWKSERKVLMAGMFVAVVALVLAVAPKAYFDRMNMIADTEEGSAQGRIEAWKAGTKMAVNSPLLGAGAGHFPMAYGGINQGRWMTAHSIYFLLLGELGFPGLIVLLAIIFTNLGANRLVLRQVDRSAAPDAATASNALACTSASLVAFATGGAFLSAAYYPHLYVISGLMASARHLARERLAAARTGASQSAGEIVRDEPRRPALRPGAISPEWRQRPVPQLLPTARRSTGSAR